MFAVLHAVNMYLLHPLLLLQTHLFIFKDQEFYLILKGKQENQTHHEIVTVQYKKAYDVVTTSHIKKKKKTRQF